MQLSEIFVPPPFLKKKGTVKNKTVVGVHGLWLIGRALA